jgi:ribose transport system permease protein
VKVSKTTANKLEEHEGASKPSPFAGLKHWLGLHMEEMLLVVLIVVLLAISPMFSPVFFSTYNIATLARQISFDILPALGQLLVVLTAGIDLSIGAILRMAQLISIKLVDDAPIPVTILVAILAGTFIGLINGLIVVKGRLEPFIVTLGTWSILDGLGLILVGGRGIAAKAPAGYSAIGRGFLAGIPYPVIIAALMVVVLFLLLHKTTFGRKIYSVGSNDLASYYSGININAIKMSVFVISGTLAGLTGVLLAARTGGFQPVTVGGGGAGTELATIAAVVVGGARLTGGRGTVLGTVMGATLTGLLFNLLVLAGIDPYLQYLILSFIILGVLLLTAWRRRKL